ncbi:uncharacterized protein JCM10292_001350 [Rhodotorula paludigena]|uniref:uncharacterized protein n=1 Tax=Rhodotorula paludigena TaxID=86838 RepID=UPI00317673FD
MDTAELVGRLATAVSEQDVLYVLCWLKEMHARDLLSSESGVRGLHLRSDWHALPALHIAALRSHSELAEFIFLLLLDFLPKPSLESSVVVAAGRAGFRWVMDLVNSSAELERRATATRHLFSLNLTEAAEWIDANLPPHPDPDSLTGCGPLPTRSSPSSPAAPASSADPASIPRPWRPPPAPYELHDASCQVRVCDVEAYFTPSRFREFLPDLEGVVDVKYVGDRAWLISFGSSETAGEAIKALQGGSGYSRAMLESTYRVAARIVQSKPSVENKDVKSQSSPSGPPTDWRPPGQIDETPPKAFSAHLGDLPLDATLEEILSLLAYAGIKVSASQLKFVNHYNRKSVYFPVADSAAFRRASAVLHGSSLRTRVLTLERRPIGAGGPSFHPSQPLIVVRHIALASASETLNRLSRLTRCGPGMKEVVDVGSGWAEGRFRVPSPDSARECVEALQGRYVDGYPLQVEWLNAAEIGAVEKDGEQTTSTSAGPATTVTPFTVPHAPATVSQATPTPLAPLRTSSLDTPPSTTSTPSLAFPTATPSQYPSAYNEPSVSASKLYHYRSFYATAISPPPPPHAPTKPLSDVPLAQNSVAQPALAALAPFGGSGSSPPESPASAPMSRTQSGASATSDVETVKPEVSDGGTIPERGAKKRAAVVEEGIARFRVHVPEPKKGRWE